MGSDISYVAPPPPPPPVPPAVPPPGGPAKPGFDFLKPFTFIFQDPRWVTKILVGGLFYIAFAFIVGIFFVLGYCARLARNVIAGVEPAAPEWDDLGEYFGEGLRLAGVALVYIVPFIAIALAFIIPAGIIQSVAEGHDVGSALASGMAGCAICLIVPLSLAVSFWVPGALLMTAVERRFGAAFEFGRIWSFISTNIGNYLLAFIVFLVARFAAGFGLVLFCVGVFFTAFWAILAATHGFAQAYKLSRNA